MRAADSFVRRETKAKDICSTGESNYFLHADKLFSTQDMGAVFKDPKTDAKM